MSGSGSMPTTARTRAAIGRASWPVPQPRSTITSWLASPNAPASASRAAGGYPCRYRWQKPATSPLKPSSIPGTIFLARPAGSRFSPRANAAANRRVCGRSRPSLAAPGTWRSAPAVGHQVRASRTDRSPALARPEIDLSSGSRRLIRTLRPGRRRCPGCWCGSARNPLRRTHPQLRDPEPGAFRVTRDPFGDLTRVGGTRASAPPGIRKPRSPPKLIKPVRAGVLRITAESGQVRGPPADIPGPPHRRSTMADLKRQHHVNPPP